MWESIPGYIHVYQPVCNNRKRNGGDSKIHFKKKFGYVNSLALFFLAKPMCYTFQTWHCSRFLLSFQVILHRCFRRNVSRTLRLLIATVADVNCVLKLTTFSSKLLFLVGCLSKPNESSMLEYVYSIRKLHFSCATIYAVILWSLFKSLQTQV